MSDTAYICIEDGWIKFVTKKEKHAALYRAMRPGSEVLPYAIHSTLDPDLRDEAIQMDKNGDISLKELGLTASKQND